MHVYFLCDYYPDGEEREGYGKMGSVLLEKNKNKTVEKEHKSQLLNLVFFVYGRRRKSNWKNGSVCTFTSKLALKKSIRCYLKVYT